MPIHARKALRTAVPPVAAPATPAEDPVYDPRWWRRFMQRVWAAAHGPTGKRLAPITPLLVATLRRHGELAVSDAVAAQLVAMSAVTSTGGWPATATSCG